MENNWPLDTRIPLIQFSHFSEWLQLKKLPSYKFKNHVINHFLNQSGYSKSSNKVTDTNIPGSRISLISAIKFWNSSPLGTPIDLYNTGSRIQN